MRKPRRKCKHKVNSCRTCLYGTYLLFMKHHGAPPSTKDLTSYFMLYSTILALDIMLLINFTFHCLMPMTNFAAFGWAFMFVLVGVPYLSPIFAIASACSGSQSLMKTSGNFNTVMIVFNIPATLLCCFFFHDDALYILLLVMMLLVKSALSATGAKIRQFLSNPRYTQNNQKLMKMMAR